MMECGLPLIPEAWKIRKKGQAEFPVIWRQKGRRDANWRMGPASAAKTRSSAAACPATNSNGKVPFDVALLSDALKVQACGIGFLSLTLDKTDETSKMQRCIVGLAQFAIGRQFGALRQGLCIASLTMTGKPWGTWQAATTVHAASLFLPSCPVRCCNGCCIDHVDDR